MGYDVLIDIMEPSHVSARIPCRRAFWTAWYGSIFCPAIAIGVPTLSGHVAVIWLTFDPFIRLALCFRCFWVETFEAPREDQQLRQQIEKS